MLPQDDDGGCSIGAGDAVSATSNDITGAEAGDAVEGGGGAVAGMEVTCSNACNKGRMG